MNLQFSYRRSLRVKKAILANFLAKIIFLKIILIVFLATIGVLLLYKQQKFGYLLLALALADWMFFWWYQWDLKNLDYQTVLGGSSLDQILSSDIVGKISLPISPKQLLITLSDNWQTKFIFNHFLIDIDAVLTRLSDNPNETNQVFNVAYSLSEKFGKNLIDAGSLVTALIITSKQVEQYLISLKLSFDDILAGYSWQQRLISRLFKPKRKEVFGGIGRDWAAGFTPVLDMFGQNISSQIQKGKQDFSSLAHQEIIQQMITHLARPDRNSVVLVGDPGVGKTSLVYGLADRLIRGEESALNLAYKQIFSLNVGAILSAVEKGLTGLEDLIYQIFADLSHAGNMIVFLDEAQLFFGKGAGSIDISQVLLPLLEQSSFQMIVTATPEDWQKISASHPTFAQLFNRLDVPETDEAETISVLQDIAVWFELRSKLIITYQALKETYALSSRYITGGAFPAKAINLLEDSLNYPEGNLVTAASVQKAVEITQRVKVTQAGETERKQLLNLEQILHQRMVNQQRAVEVVSSALRRLRAGVKNPNRPAGSFLFLGPTGVGKTEMARTLASVYFGGEDKIIRLDMSEYQRPGDVQRIIEAATQEKVGSSLLSKVKESPFSVVLLDEIEKAHPDILNLLLQMLDEGKLTDSLNREVSFKEAIVIATSNAGADEIRKQIDAGVKLEDFEESFINKLIDQNIFRPELLNRFDEIVLFRPLNKAELMEVANLLLAEVNQTIASQKVSVSLTPAALNKLIELSYDPRLGARPIRRAIQRFVEDKIAKKLLSGEIQPGDKLTLDIQDIT